MASISISPRPEPLMPLSRLSADLSVRSRLIVLSLIPVVGFAAIAFAYVSSEHAVEKAFSSVQQSSRMADASRAFKDALTTMHMSAKDFVGQPQTSQVASFKQELGTFQKAFVAITTTTSTRQRLTDQVKAYTAAFAAWVASTEKISRAITIISAETRQMLPAADEIIASAASKTTAAAGSVA